MKRCFFVVLICFATLISHAAVVNGTCGDNLTWSLNTQDSTLIFEGAGAMTDWANYSIVPWATYCSYIAYISLPAELTNIGNNAFYNCVNIRTVHIPSSVTSIGNNAFNNCTGLASIEIPNSVTTIGNMAFYNCTSVNVLEIPNGVISIGNGAFGGCHGLTFIEIPYGVTSIGTHAFQSCSNLTSVVWRAKNCQSSNPFYDIHTMINSFLIGNQVESIPAGLCKGMSNLNSVEIPNSVQHIGDHAFQDCSGLLSISIPNSVTSIDKAAFDGCTGLTAVKISNLSVWCSIDFETAYTNPLYYAHNLYLDDELITDLVIPNGVAKIGNRAFHSCNCSSVTIPNGVQSIGDNAFYNCTSLKSVIIGNDVTTINKEAFKKCSSLQTVIIGDGIDSIGNGAFGSDPITRLYMYAAVPPTGGINSGIINTSCNLYVPDNVIDTYANTVWWEDFVFIGGMNRLYPVKFLDWNGTIILEQMVYKGDAAIEPANPSREGYSFIGWGTDFSNVQNELYIIAQYEKDRTYTIPVYFVDRDGNELSRSFVVDSAPNAPFVQDYEFVEWRTLDNNIENGITIVASYTPDNTTQLKLTTENNHSHKLIYNGQIYILRGDKTYTLQGQEVK